MAHIIHICPPSQCMHLNCHIGNVQACCIQIESEALIRLQTNHDFKVGLCNNGACMWQLGARIWSADLLGMCLIVILFTEKFYWNVWDHAQITA
jgi:hypothetical protein